MAQVETLTEVPAARRGSVGEVATLAAPLVLATIAETVMQVIDTAMLGHLGSIQMGAVGFAGLVIWNCFVLFTGTAQGVQAFVSRHDGANEQRRCGPWIGRRSGWSCRA
jgi:MATE family multidrug resistance protein